MNFDNVLDDLRGTILDFDISSFTSKDTVPHKAQHVLASALFSTTCCVYENWFCYPKKSNGAVWCPIPFCSCVINH